MQKLKTHSYCRVIALGYCVGYCKSQEKPVETKTLQKPTITTDIDIDIENDIDIDIDIILFPKVNNIFRHYVLAEHNPKSGALRGRR